MGKILEHLIIPAVAILLAGVYLLFGIHALLIVGALYLVPGMGLTASIWAATRFGKNPADKPTIYQYLVAAIGWPVSFSTSAMDFREATK